MNKNQYDFKKEWEKAKKQFVKFGQEAVELAKRGEKEFKKLSHRGKLHLDSTAVNLKREHLYYLLGRESIKAKVPMDQYPTLQPLVEELNKLEEEQKLLKRKIKSAGK